ICLYFSIAINQIHYYMKTLSKTFLKTITIFVIIFAFTFSSNIHATTSVNVSAVSTSINTSSASVNALSTNLYATSTAQYALTWGWLRDLLKAISGGGNHQGGGNHGSHGGGGNQGGGDSVPLDGGLGILLIGAAALGVKKLRDKKNDKF
uniref:PID-CTERM protein-sorting domain-containing protein n=1 Tax=Mariniflexile sp. TaxID=1979402 RepID=UPI004047A982